MYVCVRLELNIMMFRSYIMGMSGYNTRVLECWVNLTNHIFISESTTKSKLAALNEKLDTLERRLELLEVQVNTASANPSVFK